MLAAAPPKANPRFFLAAAALGRAGTFLDGDLRDEVPHLPDRGLGFVLGRGVNDVLDLLAGGVHRFKLIGWHRRNPCQNQASIIVSRRISSAVVTPWLTKASPASRSPTIPFLCASVAHLVDRGIHHDHVPQLVGDNHQLEQTDATLVARVVAHVAAHAADRTSCPALLRASGPASPAVSGVGVDLFAALGADAPHQSLGQDRFHRGRDQKRRDPHVLEPRDRAGCVVRVQRAEHRVPGERGLDGDFRRLQVANLADQDLVGILPQNGPQAGGKRVADVRVDRDLDDPFHVVFDRIFGRDQLVLDAVEFIQRRVERRGLAGTGGSGHQNNAVGLSNDFAKAPRSWADPCRPC